MCQVVNIMGLWDRSMKPITDEQIILTINTVRYANPKMFTRCHSVIMKRIIKIINNWGTD